MKAFMVNLTREETNYKTTALYAANNAKEVIEKINNDVWSKDLFITKIEMIERVEANYNKCTLIF